MGDYLLPWMDFPPDPNIDLKRWLAFRQVMANWLLVAVLVTMVGILIAYAVHARRKKIHAPSDLFASYTPMYWLALAVVPGVVIFFIYKRDYGRIFNTSPISYMSGAVGVALWTILLTILLAYLTMLFPHVTPPKFRYRPYWFIFRSKGARVE